MIGSIFAWFMIAFVGIGWYFDLRENARRRKRDPHRERMRRIYARQRRKNWQPLAKHPKMPKRPGGFNVDKIGQPSLF